MGWMPFFQGPKKPYLKETKTGLAFKTYDAILTSRDY
jgi:hypothetical protein